MSETKPRKDFAIHVNQVDIVGRVCGAVKDSKDQKFVRVPIVVPAYKKGGGQQWINFFIDVVDDHRVTARKAKVGDYFRCTCFLADRQITDDTGAAKTIKTLQIDPYRDVGLMEAQAPSDPDNPPMDGICHTRVLIAGRHFINKSQLEKGQTTPVLRDGNGKYCYVKVRYENPFQTVPEGEWPKSIFFDFSLNGAVAERVAEHCRNRAQVLVRGTLSKGECRFEVKGKTPKEPHINVIPAGFSFYNLDQQSQGQNRSEPKGPQSYSPDDMSDLDLGDASATPAAPAASAAPQLDDDQLPF